MRKLLFSALCLSLFAVSCDIVEFKTPDRTSEADIQWGKVSFCL